MLLPRSVNSGLCADLTSDKRVRSSSSTPVKEKPRAGTTCASRSGRRTSRR